MDAAHDHLVAMSTIPSCISPMKNQMRHNRGGATSILAEVATNVSAVHWLPVRHYSPDRRQGNRLVAWNLTVIRGPINWLAWR